MPSPGRAAVLFRIAIAALVFSAGAIPGSAQQTATPAQPTAPPDAPQPQQATPQQQPGSKTPPTQHELAEQQLQQEEKQRILRVVPSFENTSNLDAAPLSSGQKFRLAVRTATDPFVFVTASADAGLSQATNKFPGYGQGIEGYAKRLGASYADTFDGNLWSNAIFPSLLHQDPRYFRLGHGKISKRTLWAIASIVWTKNDNGTWGFNYSNVLGNIATGGVSNLYYPASDRGVGLTFQRAFTVTAEGAIGAIGVEFWPDIARKVFHGKGLGQTTIGANTGAEPAPPATPPTTPVTPNPPSAPPAPPQPAPPSQ
jgi:hypothetical protein